LDRMLEVFFITLGGLQAHDCFRSHSAQNRRRASLFRTSAFAPTASARRLDVQDVSFA